jgi:hypothetical protein
MKSLIERRFVFDEMIANDCENVGNFVNNEKTLFFECLDIAD